MKKKQEIKYSPIIFPDEMVQFILDGDKTQTRRIVKEKEIRNRFPMHIKDNVWGWGTEPRDGIQVCGNENTFRCPYGKVGDRLWVRETFGKTVNINNYENWPKRFHKKIDERTVYIYRADGSFYWCDEDGRLTYKAYWSPSVHMPREASRITLEIKNIRIERLNEISNFDAECEGIQFMRDVLDWGERLNQIQLFGVLWEYINGHDSWELNPWVWVIEFEKNNEIR
ncbi:hypothetical protein [Leptospira alexanderi]|uniref:hypothetical protein n=1 Tax=Leptospira alexanderi TaxID=100053 RepID=UPI000990FE34|nr:hypothetical protein [Leptospira alexanderi]